MGRKYTYNTSIFKDVDKNSSYLLGYITSDGYISKNGFYLVFDLKSEDKEIIDFIVEHLYIKGTPLINERKLLDKNYSKISIGSKEIVNDLNQFEIVTNKSFNTTFLQLKDDLMSNYIKGYLDGDGSIIYSNTKRCIQFLGTKEFLQGLKEYLKNEIGIGGNKIIKPNKKTSNIYRLSYTSTEDILKLCEYLYQDGYVLERKYLIYQKIKSDYEQGIIKSLDKKSKYKGVYFDKSRNKWGFSYCNKSLNINISKRIEGSEEDAYKQRTEFINSVFNE